MFLVIFVRPLRGREEGGELLSAGSFALLSHPRLSIVCPLRGQLSLIPCSLFPAPCSLLLVPYSLFPIPYSLLPAPYSLLPTPYSLY